MDLEEACNLAACEAARVLGTTVENTGVFAWYDRRSKRSFPEVGFGPDFCVNWEQLAASRGADVRVELEGGDLIVLCGSTSKH
jgi:hypothetical protein